MLAYALERLGGALLTVLVMALLVFLGIYTLGDPVEILAAPDADAVERAAVAARLGLDQPLVVQFGRFLADAVRGDLGRSFTYNEPALGVILDRLPATMELALVALVFSVVIGVPLGMWAGLYPDSVSGRVLTTGSILGFSLPNFWIGLMLILLFAVELGWFPSGGRGEVGEVLGVRSALFTGSGWSHLLLPACTLAIYKAALVMRLARAGTREAMGQDYVRFARAKGVSGARIVGVHILKNIMIPVVTVLGLELGSMIAFAVVTETVFAYPGMGKLLIDSIARLDRPIVVAYLLVTVVLFVVINLVVDLAYAMLDPRVRLGAAR